MGVSDLSIIISSLSSMCVALAISILIKRKLHQLKHQKHQIRELEKELDLLRLHVKERALQLEKKYQIVLLDENTKNLSSIEALNIKIEDLNIKSKINYKGEN